MKKKNLNSLKLNKQSISNFSKNSNLGGQIEISERRTDCELCPDTGTDTATTDVYSEVCQGSFYCYTRLGVSCFNCTAIGCGE